MSGHLRQILGSIDASLRNDEELISRTEEIYHLVKKLIPDPNLIRLHLDWARISLGRRDPSRPAIQASSGMSPQVYLKNMKRIKQALIAANFDFGGVDVVGGLLDYPQLVPWANSLIQQYETSKSINRQEQPLMIYAAFDLILKKKKFPMPLKIQDLFCLEAGPLRNISEEMKGCCGKVLEAIAADTKLSKSTTRNKAKGSEEVEVVVEIAATATTSNSSILHDQNWNTLISIVPFYEDPLYMHCLKQIK